MELITIKKRGLNIMRANGTRERDQAGVECITRTEMSTKVYNKTLHLIKQKHE